MKTVLAWAFTLLATVAPSFAADVSLTGELVDQACYLKDKSANRGVGHQDCATNCAMKGQTVALVTDDGQVYAVAGDMTKDNNMILAPHMSHRVVITGVVSEDGGKKTITAATLKMAPSRF
jgi:type 1 fimbria pilin